MKHFALWCNGDHFGAVWSVLVHFGAPHVQPHDPSMTCSDSYPLSSVHLIKKWIILVTQDKFEILFSVMLWKPLWCILVNFGAFGCTPCATLWPLHDLLSLLSSFKCPLNAKMDHISHSGQIRNTLLWHAMETTLVHFGLFWCTTWATPRPLYIEFSWSHQKYASYTSRALKHNQSHLSSPWDTDLTWALSMGYGGKNHFFSKTMPSLCRGDF